jgi:excisionase family DNA binding protein
VNGGPRNNPSRRCCSVTHSAGTLPNLRGVTVGHHTLHEVAELLGVHYMTAYRYVRHGQLSAEKVDGEWRVTVADLEAFREGSGSGSSRGVPGRSRRTAPWAERMEARLIAGDGSGAWGVVEGAMSAGASVDRVYTEVIAPAMVSIGDRWAAGELDIAAEHRASAVVQRLIGRLGPMLARRGRSRGVIVVGAPAGERHSIVVSMLADLLRAAGWEVSDLGADVPGESFVTAAAESDPVAVILSVTDSANLPAAAEACAAIRTGRAGTIVIAGGHALVDSAASASIGADHCPHDVDELLALLGQLVVDSRSA